MFRILIALILVGTAVAYFTKPSRDTAEKALQQQMFDYLARQDVGDRGNFGENAALLFCKMKPNACYDMVRGGLDLAYEDRTLYAKIALNGFDKQARCYGAFSTFYCPGGIQDAD